MIYKDGEPCRHPGCLSHVTQACEGCGRVAGRMTDSQAIVAIARERCARGDMWLRNIGEAIETVVDELNAGKDIYNTELVDHVLDQMRQTLEH